MPPPPPTAPPNRTPELSNPDPYNSASDSDFDPDAAVGTEAVRSDSSDDDDNDVEEGGVGKARATKRKSTTNGDEGDGLGSLDSGDEATVRKGRKRRRKGKGKGEGADAGTGEDGEEEGGEGGLVKTRAQRAREEKERKPLASAESATVDVDALWRGMTSVQRRDGADRKEAMRTGEDGDVDTAKAGHGQKNGAVVGHGTEIGQIHATPAPTTSNAPSAAAEETITIKRTYVFAGETITEEKQVAKTSAEARLYLRSQQEANVSPSAAPMTKPPLRRPKKRTSIFEPNPEGTVKGLTPTGASANKGPKLNTIEKSKLDWAGFVDQEGIQEELDGAGKAKEGYLARMDFLGRVEAKREEEAKEARRK